jgi:hypothetical protein
MKIKITEKKYVTKQMNKKDSSGKAVPTVQIQTQVKTKIVHV